MPPSYTAALLLARALVDAGLTQVVISPGSRSTPLTAALVSQPELHCYPALDERGAAFFALGLALASGKPAALVCTSGTAAANYYPAIIEANQSRVPLLLLTADRPHELRDSGANQTIDQIHLYGNHVRWFVDAPPPEETPSEVTQRALRTLAARALYTTQYPLPGPVHINLPYRKPLNPPSPHRKESDDEELPSPFGERASTARPPSPHCKESDDEELPSPFGERASTARPPSPHCKESDNEELPSPFGRGAGGEGSEHLRILPPNLLPSGEQIQTLLNLLQTHTNPLILCGPRCPAGDFPNQLINFARKTNATLIADITSGLRFGTHVTRHPIHSPAILQNPPFTTPSLVIQFGALPIAAAAENYLAALPPETLRIATTPYADFPDPTHRLNLLLHTNPTALLQAINALLPPSPYGRGAGGEGFPMVGAVGEGNLILASSLPIRLADSDWQPHPTPMRVFANRGASGIDGTIATAAGIAAATPTAPYTLLYIGDVAFYHDLNSLHLLRHAAHPVIIILLNNNGGRIFERLPIAEHPNLLQDWFVMPHGLTFEGAAQTFGLQYIRIATYPELNSAIQSALAAQSATTHTLIEFIQTT